MLNIQIGIASFLYKIMTIFACMVQFLQSNSNMLSKFSREPRGLPWQPNLDKSKPKLLSKFSMEPSGLPWQPNLLEKSNPKLHKFHFYTRNLVIFERMVGLSGSANLNMQSEFSREQRELPWQPKFGKNCTDFSSVQDMEILFACKVGFWGSANSNMLSEILREPRELSWQPNLGKNKPKLH